MQTLKDLLTFLEQGRTYKEMGMIIGDVSAGHYGNIKNRTKNMTIEHIERLVKHDNLPREIEERLLVAAGHHTYALDPAAAEFNTLLVNGRLSAEQRELISDNAVAFIQCWMHYLTAKQMQYNREWPAAQKECEAGIALSQALLARIQIYLRDTAAVVSLHLSDFDRVASQQSEIEKLARTIAQPTRSDSYIEAMVALHQGDYHREVGNWAQSTIAYERARQIFKELDRPLEHARCERKLAIIELYLGRWKPAELFLRDCRSRFTELDTPHFPGAQYEIAKTDYTLGWVYNLAGDFEKAHEAHERGYQYALKYRTRDGKSDEYLIMLGRSYLANDARQARRCTEAVDIYKEVIKRAKALSDDRSKAWAHLGLARCYQRMAQKAPTTLDETHYAEQAEQHFNSAIDILEIQSQYIYRYAMTRIHAANFKIWQGKYAEAESQLTEALRITRELRSHYYEAEAQVFLCKIYCQRKQYQALEITAKNVVGLHIENSYSNLLARLRFIEAKACIQQDKYQEAAALIGESLSAALDFNTSLVDEFLEEFDQELRLVARSNTQAARNIAHSFAQSVKNNFEAQKDATAAYNDSKLRTWDRCIKRIVSMQSHFTL